MSLETLRQNLMTEAGSGKISIRAATFTASGLISPKDLDLLLSQAFVDINAVAQGLIVATSPGQIGPIENNAFSVTGIVNVQIAQEKPVSIRFSAAGSQGAVVVGIDLGAEWKFGQSFISLNGQTWNELNTKVPWFYFSGQLEGAYPWNQTTVVLSPGLNFVASVAIHGYLQQAVALLPGLQPLPEYMLSGAIDPSADKRTTPKGTVYGFPGLWLRTTPLATAGFDIGYLTVEAPYLSITGVDYGEDVGMAPAVMVAAGLRLPGVIKPPEFRAQLTPRETGGSFAYTIVNPDHDQLAFTADQLFYLMAGSTFYRLVPAQLVSLLQGFGFRSFGIYLEVEPIFRIASVQVVIASGQPWVVMADPKLTLTFELDWTINAPFTAEMSQYATLEARARFMEDLFPGEFSFVITTDLVVSGRYVAAGPEEYVSFNDLVAAVTGGLIKIPKQFIDIQFQEFYAIVNQPARSYSMGATTSIKLPVLGEGTLELNDVAIQLSVQRPQSASGLAATRGAAGAVAADGTRYSGTITGSLIVGPLFLLVDARYDAGSWFFQLSMQPGTTVRLQDWINSVFQAIQLPIDIFLPDISISDVALTINTPADPNLKTTYSGAGSIRWVFEILGQKIDTLARIQLTYNSLAKPNPYTGKVSATTTFDLFGVGATFTLEYEIINQTGGNQGSKIIRLIWEGLTLEYVQGTQQQELIFTADATWNLGRVILVLVRFIAPASAKELPTPWNLLNNISLAGMKVKFNFTTKAVSVSWPIGLKLFFGEISTLEVIKTPGQQVNVTLTGKFLFNNSDQVKWDALSQDPPVVPGGGDSAFDLRLLALGQHVTVPDLAAIRSVGDAVNQLTGFKQPLPTSRVVPVLPASPKNQMFLTAGGDPPAPRFSRDSNWLIGTHFYAVSGMLDLKAIFNDPVLYGLRIGLAGPKAKIFAGLEFEILYKKVTDTIGMYRVMLKLPDAMRYLQFGAVTVILPVVTVEVYTNGNFKVDFGFPRNLDFSLSFTVQVFPFTGSGGFYFGWLNGATSTQTPANPSCGTFNPVIEFGFGLQVGLGKSVNVAILRAEISVTIFGIIEGVIGTWRPYSDSAEQALSVTGADGRRRLLAPGGRELAVAAGQSSDVATAYYYKVTGTLGIIGRIVGVVDFAIIKAEVSLTVYAYIQGTFEAYRKTLVTLEAGVRISVKLTINCGFFKITINLSFSARIREQFVIGTDRLQEAPWYCGGKTQLAMPVAATFALRPSGATVLAALATGPNFAPLKTPTYGQLPLDVFFVPQLSISGEAAAKQNQSAVYSANLFISNEARKQGELVYEPFRRLVRDTYLWIASSFSGEPVKGTPEQELDRVATYAQMLAARDYLGANSDGRALTYGDISAFLGNLFRVEIKVPPVVVAPNPGPSCTAFPMPPELAMKATYKDAAVAVRDFADWVMADEAYLTAVQTAINKLLANLLDELERQHDPGSQLRAMFRSASVDTRSIANFVFGDYFVMLARGVVQDALDAFDTYAYAVKGVDSIASIRQYFNTLGDGNQNHVTDEQIAWTNRDHALAEGIPLTLNDVPYRIQDGDTLGAIAAQHGLEPEAIAQDNATVDTVLIPGRPITISGQTHPVPNRGTIALTAAEFGMPPSEFGKSIAAMPDVLSPLTVIILNGQKHLTAAKGAPDTIASVAQLYGIEVPVLTPSIATVGGLFSTTPDPRLRLAGLAALTNCDLWNDIELSSGVEHLSGMAGRYLLNGLRLPTAGLVFKDPAHPCKTVTTCGLENLIGQQFPLPALDGYDPKNPLSIALANPKAVPWVVFVNPVQGGDPSVFTFLVPVEAANQVNELVAYARKIGLSAPIAPPAAEDLALVRAREYTFKNNIVLQTAASLPLPNEASGITPRPRIWNFNAGLQSELSRPVALSPLFRIEIGSTDTNGGRILPRAANSYGFATLINVAIKRVTATVAHGQPVSPTTYELVGADEVGVNQLERLLHAISPASTSIINGIYIVYPPNQSSDRAQGLQYDGEDRYTTFLVRGNLSTETNPPTAAALDLRLALAGPPRGLLNSDYNFISMLWEGSIVRSGGYYFKYVLPDGSGLPEPLFNEDNLANISVLVVYSRIDGFGGEQGGVLKDFMNAAVVADPIDDSNDVVYVASAPRAATVEIKPDTTLAGISEAYHAGVIDIAWQNRTKALSLSTGVNIVDIVHQVKRGQTLAQIAAQYKTSEAVIRALNPNVDFNNLQSGTGLHIPDLVALPAAGTPGLTLPEIANSFSSTFAALAWANRDVKNLYQVSAGASTLTFSDMLNDKQAVMPPGNVGIVVTRNNPGEGEQPSVYLEQQYNLLGYDLIANTDFVAIADALPLPAGPANDEDEQALAAAKRQAPRLAAAAEPWVYRFSVPASRAARNNPVPQSTEQNPYPARDMNSYAGVGGFVQLSLDWRDMLGNHTWSPFDDSSPSNPYPLNWPPSRVGANDDVMGLAQWPSTLFDHFFVRQASQSGGELRIEWRFDPSRYSDPGPDGELWWRNAEADRQVFANLYYQLAQTARDGALATSIATVCSLAPSNPAGVGTAERAAVTAYVLTAWRYVVKVLENNGVLPPPSYLPTPVTIVRPISPPASAVIEEIAVVLRMERVTSTVLSGFRDESGSRVADTAIGPRLTQLDPTAGYTLDWYTAAFESAFNETAYSLRLASGTPRSDLGMQSGRDTLWSVRLGKEQQQAYWYRIDEPAIFFSLAPLSTQLLNGQDVKLYSFNPDSGLSPQPDQVETFTGIDLDVWARNALGGIDQLLEPQYAVPAFLVDYKGGTPYLEKILDAKLKLAWAIVTGVTNVLTLPELDPVKNAPNFDAAREKLRQQLLIKLANAYAIDAVVQYNMRITAPAEAIPPRLYGSPADPAQADEPKDYTVSTFKIPLRHESPLLSFTFATRQTSRQSSFTVPFTYVPTHIEHEISAVPEIEGFEASSWLNFVNTPPPILSAGESPVINAVIPIPLRAYPTPPTLLQQAFLAAAASTDPSSTLEKAKEWTFRFLYSQAHAAQDRIDSVVRFNVPQAQGNASLAAQKPDLFVMLARINHVLTQVQSVYTQDLLVVTVDTPTDSAQFKRAQNALYAFAFLLSDLDVQWKAWVQKQSAMDTLLFAGLDQQLPFSILEGPAMVQYAENEQQVSEEVLRVTVAYPSGLLPGMSSPPIVVFDGYTAVEVPPDQALVVDAGLGNAHEDVRTGLRSSLRALRIQATESMLARKAWIYRKDHPLEGELPYLSWDEALALPERAVEIRTLDAIRFQNAWSRIQIIRNAELVGPQNPTRRPFIYTTPEVQFRNKLTPLLDTDSRIDVAAIPTGTPQSRTLSAQLTALFQTFFKGSPSQEQLLKLEVSYAYRLGPAVVVPAIEMPVLLYPPAAFEIPPDWQKLAVMADGQALPAAVYIETVAKEIKAWFKGVVPSTVDGVFRFDLSAFSSLNTNNQPLVRVRNLVLAAAMISDLTS